MPDDRAFDVEFRYGGVQTPEGELGIIVLGYQSRAEGEQAYANIHSYITAGTSTPRLFDIKFEREGAGTYQLIINIGVGDISREIRISAVASEYVGRLTSSLSNVPFYLIAAGYYDDDEFHLLPLKQYNFFRGEIEIDGETVVGVSKPGFDPSTLLDQLT